MKALANELKNKISVYNITTFDTVFFGGGTPSSIKISLYDEVFKILSNHINEKTEITFEANPNSATYEWLKEIKNFGVCRISFGVQSFDNEKLKYLGRSHDRQKAIEAIEISKKVGIDAINCDILYNTKCDTKKLILDDLEIIKDLQIEHLSAYSLTIEEETKFYDLKTKEIFNEKFSKFCIESIKNCGFIQYEISNFAKNKEYFSKHNLGYWEKKDYIGVGAGAYGCIQNKRYANEKNIAKYISSQTCEIENLSDDDIQLEIIFLGLRSCVGIDKNILTNKQLQNANFLVQNKKLKLYQDRFFNENFLITDELALFITRS